MNDRPSRSAARWLKLLVGAAVAAAVLGAGAVYVILPAGRNAAAVGRCPSDAALIARLKPLATGEVAAMLIDDRPKPLPTMAFKDAAGKPVLLADFRGKTVLFNMWATWCAPCRAEMPALDTLQAELGGEKFDVVAVSVDATGPDKPRKFFNNLNLTHLALHTDGSGEVFRTMQSIGRGVGLPTSLLVDKGGCEIGYMPGPAQWASPDAKALIEAALPSDQKG
jgi:thiol-disulfide isomerase/thioredoxin